MNSEIKSPIIASDVVIALLGYFARLVVGFFLLVVCISVIKVHFEYWKQIEAKLPSLTVNQTWFSMFVLKDGWWMLPPLVAVGDLAVTLLLVLRFRHHRWLSSAYSQILLLGAIGFMFWVYLCVTVPLGALLPEPTQ
jgi:hypothetical protein